MGETKGPKTTPNLLYDLRGTLPYRSDGPGARIWFACHPHVIDKTHLLTYYIHHDETFKIVT